MTEIDSIRPRFPQVESWRPAAWIGAKTFLFNSAVALLLYPLLENTYSSLWVSAQIVGFAILGFVLPTLRLSPPGRPRLLLLAGALLAGALVGTVLVVLVKYGTLSWVLQEPRFLAAFATTAVTGVIFGGMTSLVMAARTRIAVSEKELMRSEAERQKLARQTVEAELQVLRAQVEPHFLFNTLAAVEHLTETDPPRAGIMLRHLIDFLRGSLPNMRQQETTLGREVELCRSYLAIMQIRMEDRLSVAVDIPESLRDANFPPMMLQSVVENAIKHGLEPKPEGGSVTLSAQLEDGRLRVTVADTGRGIDEQAPQGIGLGNIRDRLKRLYENSAALTLAANAPSGARITIEVPCVPRPASDTGR